MGVRTWIGLAVIVVIAVGLLVANAVVYEPRRERLTNLTREIAIAEQELAFIAGHTADLARIVDYLPRESEGDIEGEQIFLSEVSAEVRRVGLTLTKLEPKRVIQDGSYTRRSYKLEVEGGYRQMANFLRYLETIPEVVIIDSFEIYSRLIRRGDRHGAIITLTVIGY